MIPKDCKRLAEVDFPIAEVSRHAARDLPAVPAAVTARASHEGSSLLPVGGCFYAADAGARGLAAV